MQYTDPISGTVYTSPEVARQYGVSVPTNISSGVDINAQTQQANQAISLNQLNTATPITVPQATPTANPLEATAASATATTKSLADYIKELTPPETATSKAYDAKTAEVNALLPSVTGRGEAQLAGEQAAGLPQMKQRLADINAQLLSKVAEATKSNTSYEQLIANLENPNNAQQQGIPMSAIIGQQAQVRKMQLAEANNKSADINLLQAFALGLQGQVQAAQSYVDRAIDLRYQDAQDTLNLKIQQLSLLEGKLNKEETIVKAALERKYQDEQQALEDKREQDKIIQNLAIQAASSGADNATIKAIGASTDPIQAAQAVAQFVKTQNNLKNLSQYTVSSPYVLTAGGEVQDSQSGYGFTSELDFQQKTGMTIDQAVAKGLLKPLGQTKAEQQQGFENSIALKQLGVSQYNAQTSRINANQPTSSVVELSDGTKSVVTIDKSGNILNQQPLETGSSGKTELQLAKSQDSIATVSNLLNDKALNSAVGPIAAARGGITLPFGIKIPTTTKGFTGKLQNFIGSVEQLRSGLNLDALIKAKAQGATFGALSDQELQVLASSASKIGTWAVKDKNGQITGYNANEKDFRNELQRINNFAKLDYIIKGGNPQDVGVKQEPDGSLTTINWDGTVTQIYK